MKKTHAFGILGTLAVFGLVAASVVQLAQPASAARKNTCRYTCFDGAVCIGKDAEGIDCVASPGENGCRRTLPPCVPGGGNN